MEMTQELRELLQVQRKGNRQLEELLTQLEQADFLQQNRELKAETAGCRRLLDEQKQSISRLERENAKLREQLAEQIYAQRSELLRKAETQAAVLFAQEERQAVDRLAAYNAGVRQRLGELREQLGSYQPEANELLKQLDEIEQQSKAFMFRQSSKVQQSFDYVKEQVKRQAEEIRREPLTERQMQEKLRQNSVEMAVGVKVTVVIGVFFMLLAVVFGLRYTYLYLLTSDLVKGLLAYFIGALFLTGGEVMNRRSPGPFSIGITAGGVAILFASTAMSYFSLGILSMLPALALCGVIAVASLFLAYRYNSQLIGIFALIGGYLPVAALGGEPLVLYGAMAYFLVLSLLVLLLAAGKHWQPLKYFGLIAGFLSEGYLLSLQDFGNLGANLSYISANFLLYLAIVLVYPVLKNKSMEYSDLVLLELDTVFSCGYLYHLLNVNGYGSTTGAVALGFCILFFLLAKLLKLLLREDVAARGFLYATAFAFWVLSVPLHFSPDLITMGWLVQGVALCVFGVLTNRRWYRRAGAAISLLCLCFFLLYDLPTFLQWPWGREVLFVWRYAAVTAGSLVILGTCLYQKYSDTGTRALRFCGILNFWWFACYLCNFLMRHTGFPWRSGDYRFWHVLAYAVITMGLALIYRAIPYLKGKSTKILTWVQLGVGLYMTLLLNTYQVATGWVASAVAATVLLIAFDAATVVLVYYLARRLFVVNRSDPEWFPLVVSLYALVLAVMLLMVQLRLDVRNMSLTLFLLVWALGTILFGFVRRFSLMRRFGLALSLVTITKLFFVDLWFLQSGQRIISYFVFGIIFIGISYLYQHFSRKLFPVTANGAAAEAASEAADNGPAAETAQPDSDGDVAEPDAEEESPPPEGE